MSIWHNKKEKPAKKLHCNRLIITKWGSCLDEIDIDNGATIETDWAFLDDLLALETELDHTRKALDKAKLILKNLLPDLNGYERLDVEKSINEITALEQKDTK